MIDIALRLMHQGQVHENPECEAHEGPEREEVLEVLLAGLGIEELGGGERTDHVSLLKGGEVCVGFGLTDVEGSGRGRSLVRSMATYFRENPVETGFS